MATRYHITLPEPELARGPEPALSFSANGAEAFADEVQAALSDPGWIGRWQQMQEEPDEVEDTVLAVDRNAEVRGAQRDLKIDLTVTTSLPGSILSHRMGMLAGDHWQLRNVTSA